MEIIDKRNVDNYDFIPHGHLYVKQDPDQTFIPGFAKPLDVGLDLPVKINIDRAKFAEANETPSKLRNPMLYPELKHYISPEGSNDSWGYLSSRSSTIWKKHLMILPCTIDPGYTGPLGVLVYNPNNRPIRVYEYNVNTKTGDKLGQLILNHVYPLKTVILVNELPSTDRGVTGMGSSGMGLTK